VCGIPFFVALFCGHHIAGRPAQSCSAPHGTNSCKIPQQLTMVVAVIIIIIVVVAAAIAAKAVARNDPIRARPHPLESLFFVSGQFAIGWFSFASRATLRVPSVRATLYQISRTYHTNDVGRAAASLSIRRRSRFTSAAGSAKPTKPLDGVIEPSHKPAAAA
jgi:hypothetical protein